MININPQKTIFVVDGNEGNLALAKNTFRLRYQIFAVSSASEMFARLKSVVPDLILLDAGITDTNVIDALRMLKERKEYGAIPVIVLTDTADALAAEDCFALGAVDYITRPILLSVITHRIEGHLQRSDMISYQNSRYMNLQNGIISVLAEMINHRDSSTGGHVTRTSEFIGILLDEMTRSDVYRDETRDWKTETLVSSARLHDVGKIGIPDTILNKPAKLSTDEFAVIKTHTTEGERIIEKMVLYAGGGAYLSHASRFAGYHHERWDGAGYPRGLKGMEIPLEGRVLAVADVYDALVSERPYKKAFTAEEAERIILAEAGKHFDPYIVAVFSTIREKFRKVK